MKRELFVPLILIGLSIAFVIVCALVILSGNRAIFVRHKLELGAMILMLSGAANGCGGESSCYVAPIRNGITLEDADLSTRTVNVDLNISNVVAGSILGRESESFSFRIENALGDVVQQHPISALDGAFDENFEEFEIEVDATLATGDYALLLFETAVAQSDANTPNLYTLQVVARE